MKKNYKQCKTRFLLFFLLSLFAGGLSPAWAQVTETFEDVTLVEPSSFGYSSTLSNGWICVSSSGSANSNGIGSSDSAPYYLATRANNGEKSLGSISGSSNSNYLVIPVLMSGDITFSMCTNSTSSYTYGYVKIHKVTDNGDGTYTVNSTALSTQTKSGSSSYTWAEKKVSLGDEETMIAICAYRAFIDDFTYTPYVEAGCKKPKNLSASNLTFSTADLSWTAGEEGQDTWQVVYSTDANFDKDAASKTNVSTTSYQLTGLSDNTTYYVAVRSYCDSENQSAWATTSFTTPLAPITSFPWTENFNSLTTNGTIPAGWDNSEGTTTSSDYKWCYNSSYSTGHDGKCIRFDSYNNGNGNTSFLKTPALDFTAGSPMQLVFWYKNPKGGDFSVYISDDGGATYTTELATGLTGASSWTEKKIDIPSEFIGKSNVVIVFKGTSNYGTGDARIYLDDVTVKENEAYAWSVSGSDVVSNTIAFGTVKNNSTTKTFTITNDGASTLTGVTVTSSDNTVFTVSDTNFDIEAGATKDITVTFIKEVAGDYSETITVSQANVDNIVLTATAAYEAPSAATMAVTFGDVAVGETVAFGNVGKATTKTFTIANDGEATLNISSIASSNTDNFTVSPATLSVEGGKTGTFTVTFVYDANNLGTEKTANITVTPSNEGIAPVTFAVSATSVEMWSEDFSGNTLPSGWETTGSLWSFKNGEAVAKYQYNTISYLITPSLIVESTTDALTFQYKANGTNPDIIIYISKNGGEYSQYGSTISPGTSATEFQTGTITGLEAGNYKIRFAADNYTLDNFEGFKLNNDDPKFGVYTDAECKVAAAASVTKDFGFVTEAPETQVYYLKNDNTGTLTLTLGDVPTGFTAVLGKSSLAAGESTTLTINMPVETKGYRGGNIVVTAKNSSDSELGTFTVAASGVAVDENKLYLNFATDNIPTSWTNSNFTKNSTDISCGYNASTLQTASLTAEANEQVVVRAYQEYTSSSYTFGVNYRKVGVEEWSQLIAPANIGTSYVTLVGTIPEAGDYELQFTGRYVHISIIYGLAEPQIPFMAVYDGTTAAAATYNFGNVANDADATHTFTIKNEGNGTLAGVNATLGGDQADHYSVEISGLTDGNIAGKSEATLTVTQLKDNLGAHAATLTISSTDESIADIVIELSGVTRDASKMYVDFADGIPATWTANGSWTTSSGYAQAPWSGNATLTSPALTIAAGENLTVDLSKQYNNNNAVLTFRYTTDGGVTWSEQDLSSDLTYGEFTTKTLSLGNTEAVTAFIQFVGTYYARIDNICGGVATSAPMFALTTSEVLTDGKYDFGQSLQEAPADKVFTITNNGNGNLVSTIAATDDVTATLATTDGELSNENKTVTLEPGETATITVSLIFDASEIGEKNGSVTIDSNEPVADVVLNFTANVIDPTAFNIDFANNTKPEGWYVSPNGYIFTGGVAKNSMSSIKDLITQKLRVAGEEDVLSYDAYVTASWAESYASLVVSYSTDRKNWTEVSEQPTLATTSNTFQIKGLAAGDYYLKFAGEYVAIDNISGWHIVTGIDHDLYVSDATFPTTTLIPGTENGVEASVTVNSLRADETGVYAKLFFDETEIATAEAQDIAKDGNKTFDLTGNVPATEKTYAAKIVVYYSDNSVAWETATTEVNVAHTRTLSITDFAREGEGEIDANASNQFSAAFNVTVENTGSIAATPVVKIFIGETEVGTATADEEVAAGESKTIAVNVTNASAGEGGELHFTAKAYWTAEGEALATSDSDVTITVNAAAPKFALYQNATPVNDGDDVDFGLVKGTTETFDYTIKNEGTADLELVSIVAPTGFTVTPAITDDNKTIKVDETLAISVTMGTEEGKKSGNLVFTYQVDATTQMTFTLALSGRSIAADTWTEDFATEIPASWTNNGWEWNSDRKAAYSGYSKGHELMTPRLAAEEGEELNFDVIFPYSGEQLKVQYSTDKTNWNDVSTYVSTANNQTFEGSFIAPAAGNYYLKFGDSNSRYVYVDNFVGFRLNIPEHDIEIAASNIPTTGTQYAVYTASVTLQENAGKAEEVTAKLIVNGEEKATENETLTANGQTVITLTWTSEEVIAEAVKAKITVTGTEIDLTTEEVDLTIVEPYTLDETSSDAVVNGTYEVLVLNRSWVEGFNTVCLPFATTAEEIFGTGAIAYEFAGLIDNELRFTEVVTMEASVPYLVDAKAASTDDTKMHILRDVTISSLYTTPDKTKVGDITFQGTYAPMAAGTMAGLWGVTPKPSIAKGTADASMKGFRAYFTGLSDAGVKGFRFEGDTATGVRYVKMSADEIRDIFDLGGRKLNETRKGINIVNGKKVLVK